MNRIITNTSKFISFRNVYNLRNYTSNDWVQYISFNANRYTRNKVIETDFYEMYILCWLPGQKTPIHDHPGNGCMFKLLHGELHEQLYDAFGQLVLKERVHQSGDVVTIKDELHTMENTSKTYATSLHIYSNPK